MYMNEQKKFTYLKLLILFRILKITNILRFSNFEPVSSQFISKFDL